jgi:hypothetical protein
MVLIALLLTTGIFGASETQAASLRGKVLDAETGEPLEGATIIVVWYRPIFALCMESCSKFYDAVETLSDSDGHFTIDLSKPFLAHREVSQIYKPGYRITGFETSSNESKSVPNPVVRLMKLKSMQDHVRQNAIFSICDPAPKDEDERCVPRHKIPHTIRLEELHRKIIRDQER